MIWLASTLPLASRMGVTSVSSIGTTAFRNISNATPNGARVLNIIVIIKCAHALLYLTSMRIRPQFKLWFVDEEGEYVFGLGTMGLLAEIDKLGSISAAARKLGMTYRYALERIPLLKNDSVVNLLVGREAEKRGVPSLQRLAMSFSRITGAQNVSCLLYTSPSPRDRTRSR